MKLIFPGNPIPLKRPRFTTTGGRGKGRAYNPQEEVMEELMWDAQFQCKEQWESANKGWLWQPLTHKIELKFLFFMRIPKSYGRKKKEELVGEPHTKKADLDNLVKFYMDILAGALYQDDNQVYKITAEKRYDEEPRTEIEVI